MLDGSRLLGGTGGAVAGGPIRACGINAGASCGPVRAVGGLALRGDTATITGPTEKPPVDACLGMEPIAKGDGVL